jgi:hypothetical protein
MTFRAQHRFRRLVSHARSPQEARVIVKVGALCRDGLSNRLLLGDSLVWPIATQPALSLTTDWREYVLELPDRDPEGNLNDLSRVCSGFTMILDKRDNLDRPPVLQVYFDEVYFEE